MKAKAIKKNGKSVAENMNELCIDNSYNSSLVTTGSTSTYNPSAHISYKQYSTRCSRELEIAFIILSYF